MLRALCTSLVILTPFIPLSFKGEGEEVWERGYASLRLTLLYSPQAPERVFERGKAPLSSLPLPLIREGGQGDRFLKNPLNPLPIGFSYYTTLSDDGGDVFMGGNVKGGVGYLNTFRSNAYPLDMGYLFLAPLLNRDFFS